MEEGLFISVLMVKTLLKDKIEAFLVENSSIKCRCNFFTRFLLVRGTVDRLLPLCVVNQVASWHEGGVTRSSQQRAAASAGWEKLY